MLRPENEEAQNTLAAEVRPAAALQAAWHLKSQITLPRHKNVFSSRIEIAYARLAMFLKVFQQDLIF